MFLLLASMSLACDRSELTNPASVERMDRCSRAARTGAPSRRIAALVTLGAAFERLAVTSPPPPGLSEAEQATWLATFARDFAEPAQARARERYEEALGLASRWGITDADTAFARDRLAALGEQGPAQ